ncbi:siderophore-interacting protein [Polymorphum gilvum]|uniref:FAD-binding 9, siderophore-interacting n=1 Tax=Polymorphum gilvum (strain LMG 25793 / CGMCC 1.9160 / SL003B-26A1) TaxID=991905 RepID=F2J2D1_POLGS|nr:siderophore-interacting protein [Polymorphum gilvum]ADZ69827.1 FAD-binding 9, siderophore-interacting [Polymorphum gilvum SL003B-26A1]
MIPAQRRKPRILTVKVSRRLTPNMIRITFTGEDLADFPDGKEGAHCKLAFPRSGESLTAFAAHYAEGQPSGRIHPVRTYTVRAFRRDGPEMDIDFVAHGDEGPATRWAQAARPGDFLAFMGPGPVKVSGFHADWYLVAADMSALPVATATLEAMPRSARGVAIFEIHSAEDRQDIDMPDGIEVHWLVQGDPHQPSTALIDVIRRLTFPQGRIQTCIAGESGVIRALRLLVQTERGVDKADAYISGYWKIGMVEDEHQAARRDGRAG